MTCLRLHRLLPAISLALAVGCGGEKSAESIATTTATPVPTPVLRTVAPLPAPGQSGVYARHDGVVLEAGEDLNLEFSVNAGVASIYLLDGNGTPLPPAGWSGGLSLGETSYSLVPSASGDALEASADFPASFDAEISLRNGEMTRTAKVRYARAAAAAATP